TGGDRGGRGRGDGRGGRRRGARRGRRLGGGRRLGSGGRGDGGGRGRRARRRGAVGGRDRVGRLAGDRSRRREPGLRDLARRAVEGERPALHRARRRRTVAGAEIAVAPVAATRRDPVGPVRRGRRGDHARLVVGRRLAGDATHEARVA